MHKLLAVVTSFAVCLTMASCSTEPVQQGIGEVERVKDIAGTPIARAMGLEIYKFDYSLKQGSYKVDVWLEQDDIGSSEPLRLTGGGSFLEHPFDEGSVVVGISDPATTAPEKGKTWRVVISTDFGGEENVGSAIGTHIMPDPFHKLSGRSTAPVNKQLMRADKEIVLVTWAGGESVQLPNGPVRNERLVYLKMKVTSLEDSLE